MIPWRQNGKSFTNVALWSDGMGAQFRSRFVFQLSVGTMFLNRSLCWCYNERHHGKVPMDDVGRTIKNVILRKLKLGQIVIHTPKEFSDAIMKFVPSIITMYLPKSEEWRVVSQNMFLCLNLIFNLVLDRNNRFFILLISLFFIYKIQKLWWNGVF